MAKTLDFQSFGEELWRIANVFRDDTLKTTEYLEEFSYFFFLKLWDERERAEEAQLKEISDEPYVP
jgi:type I restriction enzyme M protein